MRKIGATSGIISLLGIAFFPLPTAAFGIHVGPFYFHFPLAWHHHHHLYMRTNPNEARTRRNETNPAKTEPADRELRAETSTDAIEGLTSRLTQPICRLIKFEGPCIRRLIKKQLSTTLAQHRHEQTISSSHHAPHLWRLLPLAASMPLSNE
jgi:hypothetical protein